MSALREIAGPFVVAPPAGTRVRTRLRVSGIDAAVLREVGGYLGSLASADLAARCAEGRLDARQRARSRRVRKQELTAKSSSRWAGALTRTSEDAYQLAHRNLLAERRCLLARIKRIEARLAVTAGKRAGRVHGYPTAAERHAKTIRIQTFRTRLAEVEQQLDTGRVSVCRGGKALLRKRNNLAAAGLTETRWRERWAASRLFITADGEKDKTWGNETIRWNPDQNWLEIRLPAPLARLPTGPGRYRLSCPVGFTYRGGDVAAQAATGAVRYDISLDPDDRGGQRSSRSRWPGPAGHRRRGGRERRAPRGGGAGPDGNRRVPVHHRPATGGPAVGTRDGRLRAAITSILTTAREHRASAVVIENLDFATPAARDANAPATGPHGDPGPGVPAPVAGIPTARFRDRLTHMACNTGMAVIAVDPAYTSRWAAQHWLAPMQQHHPKLTGHHAAAFVIGRRGLGLRARRRASGNLPAPEDAAAPKRAKSTQARSGTHPKTGTQTRRPATRTDPRQPPGTKTGRPRRTTAGDQVTQDRSGPPTRQDSLLLGD